MSSTINNLKKTKAQILLITLLVLTVLSLTIIGLIIILNRDVRQVGANQKYEQIYNASENLLIELINKYGNDSTELEDLPNDYSECTSDNTANTRFVCDFFLDQYGVVNVDSEVIVEDKKKYEGYELTKDKPFTLNLDGYTDSIKMEWDKDIALEFLFIYQTSTGEIRSISDVYNPANVLLSPRDYDSFTDPDNIHKLKFRANTSGTASRAVRFNIGQTEGFDVNSFRAISLTITPRFSADLGVVQLNLSPTDEAAFPKQARTFSVRSLDESDSLTPVVEINTFIYLFPQGDPFWNYSLLTDDLTIL